MVRELSAARYVQSTVRGVCIGLALLIGTGCGGLFETESAAAQPPPSVPVEPARSGGGLARTVAQATVRAQQTRDASPCTGGLVHGATGCVPCDQDAQCSTGACLMETGRCRAAGWCAADDACAAGEFCDAGECIVRETNSATTDNACGLTPIHFSWDSATVTPTQRARLEASAPCLARIESAYVEAHADRLGGQEFNILLSERRGAVVRDILVAAGVEPDRLMVIAKGDLEAVQVEPDRYGRDRRVVLITP